MNKVTHSFRPPFSSCKSVINISLIFFTAVEIYFLLTKKTIARGEKETFPGKFGKTMKKEKERRIYMRKTA